MKTRHWIIEKTVTIPLLNPANEDSIIHVVILDKWTWIDE
jgi:hypothetical protein